MPRGSACEQFGSDDGFHSGLYFSFRHGAKTEGGGPGEAKPRPSGKLEVLSATGHGATVPSRSRGAERFTAWCELWLLPLARWLGRRTSSPKRCTCVWRSEGACQLCGSESRPLRAGERKPRSRSRRTVDRCRRLLERRLWTRRDPTQLSKPQGGRVARCATLLLVGRLRQPLQTWLLSTAGSPRRP